MDVLHTDDAGLEWHYLCRIVCCTIEPALKVRLMISRLRRMSMPRSICWQEMLHLKCGLPAKMVVPVNWAFHAVFHSGRYSISPFRNPDASWQTNSCRFFFAMHCVEVVFFPLFRVSVLFCKSVQMYKNVGSGVRFALPGCTCCLSPARRSLSLQPSPLLE